MRTGESVVRRVFEDEPIEYEELVKRCASFGESGAVLFKTIGGSVSGSCNLIIATLSRRVAPAEITSSRLSNTYLVEQNR